ncbi:tumor necrosis factor receptor superfamily member 1A isoform X5 [Chelonia mydas]|uniref:tumor necrosis factor receptor superfamily member 1A isoform X5 n=1 Tax=Chelonia mydas TaxID=8469 RepID=UPI000FFC5FCB|nr:tumor necrosis factor receptor superfamily member 1A isoform X5 [Chelonia mydas]
MSPPSSAPPFSCCFLTLCWQEVAELISFSLCSVSWCSIWIDLGGLLWRRGSYHGDVGDHRTMAHPEPSPALVATLILTLAWVWAEECLGVAPNPDTLQIHGISLGRKKRELKCQVGEYLHSNRTHCCMRCHAGTYLAEDCQSNSLATRCTQCPKGTFTATDNILRKCISCRRCRSEFQQITLSECSEKKDTVCGCLPNQFQKTDSILFKCLNCSLCHNGTIRQKCTKNSDTICVCHAGYFLHKNSCNPCNSCNEEECKKVCDAVPRPSTSPSVQGHTILLVGLVVVLAASLGLLFAVKLIKQYRQKLTTAIFYSCVSTQQPKREPVSEVSKVVMNERKASTFAPVPPQIEKMWTANAVPRSMVAQELPDCVRPAGKTQLPDNPVVLYTVADHVLLSRWKEFVRRLGLSDYEIERIELEQRRVRDAQYEMLRQWRLQMGQGATVERISYVLNQMELSGCSEAIQEALSRQP